MLGTVYKSTGSWYKVKLDNGKFIDCKLQAKFRDHNLKSTNPICVGDIVKVKINIDQISFIESITDRQNYLIRKSVKLSRQFHIIASNIDICFLIITVKNPETSTMFIDRFLASTFSYNIKTVLLFNKIDDIKDDYINKMDELISIYTNAGYDCIKISGKKSINIDKLRSIMINKSCVFSGHSGVGKSTLINRLDSKINIKTLPISKSNLSGQHTTTFSEMYDLEFGSRIIDTPGIKGFGLYDTDKYELKDFFKEFTLLEACKFNNCLHQDEPGCMVKSKLEMGEISYSRYNNYIQLLTDIENNYRI
jgi:ribosome biogenesis GTPase